MIHLRPYQQDIINAVKDKWIEGNKRLVVCSPGGSGKTVMFSYMSKQSSNKGSKVLILTHREELLSQTSGTLVNFGIHPSIIAAGIKNPPTGDIFVGMVETVINRLSNHDWREWYKSINLVVCDECHMQEFNRLFDDPLTKEKYVLGFSATPRRTGRQRQLSDDYEDMIQGLDVQQLINMGFLVPDRYFSVPVDLKGVSISKGEFDNAQMYDRYDKQELYSGVIDNWERICPNTITLIFCCNIQHSINTCKAFNARGIKAKFIVSDVAKPKPITDKSTPAEVAKFNIKKLEYENYIANFESFSGKRKEVIDEWKRGEFKVLINSGIATTGFDHPLIETVVLNRATMSENLCHQMIVRGSRISEGKDFFYLLDFGENCKRLGYYRQQQEYSLTHEVSKSGGGVCSVKDCPKCKALITASSKICKYCGFVFPQTHEEKIVELTEIPYSEAVTKLETINDYEIFCKAKGYSKNWVFRQIYMKWGKDGLIEYQKAHNLAPSWVYIAMARYRAEGIIN